MDHIDFCMIGVGTGSYRAHFGQIKLLQPTTKSNQNIKSNNYKLKANTDIMQAIEDRETLV